MSRRFKQKSRGSQVARLVAALALLLGGAWYLGKGPTDAPEIQSPAVAHLSFTGGPTALSAVPTQRSDRAQPIRPAKALRPRGIHRARRSSRGEDAKSQYGKGYPDWRRAHDRKQAAIDWAAPRPGGPPPHANTAEDPGVQPRDHQLLRSLKARAQWLERSIQSQNPDQNLEARRTRLQRRIDQLSDSLAEANP